jgi:hypothetical protein
MFARQVPYHLSHIVSPFCSGYSGNRVFLFAQACLDHDPLRYAFHCSWNDRCISPVFSSVAQFLFFFFC